MGLEMKQKSTEIFEKDYTVSYYQLFRYARWYEILATIVGILLGLASGGSVCFVQVQFGELTTAFVQRTAHPEGTSSRMPTLEWFNGGRRLTNASYSENMDALMEDGIALAIGMTISLVFSLICIWVAVILVNWSALRQTSRIRLLFLQAVMRQDMAWFDTDTNFNLASRMSEDMLKLKDGMGDKLAIIGNLVGTAILCTCVAIPLGWKLSLACMTVVPFSIAASVVLSNYQTRSSFREMEAYSQAGKQAEEVLKSVRTVVAFGGEFKEVEKYKNLLAPAERYGIKRGLYTGLGTGFNWVLTYSLNAIGLAYGTKLVLEDLDKPVDQRDYVFGDILSILFNIYMATQSITFCVPHGETFSAAKAAAGTIFKLLDREPAIDSLSAEGLSPRRVVGDLLLEDVHFSYPSRPDVKVLKGFSIHIRAGETVALVGSSGCGKSTILQLIQRLYDPASGVVKLDGKNTKSLNLGWLRSCLGVVGQEPVLFKGSIHENIAIGIPEATREEVQRVAEMAHAHTFITNLPKGYDTVIGERGATLSGGQKQRIAIARSLLREPAVLLLDEATSALDPHSERQVQGALDRAAQGRTTLLVSHRLSTIVNADRIVCMDQGAIVEQGSHEELLKAKGFYWNLVSTGKDAQEPDIIETVDEEAGDETKQTETALVPRSDPIRRSRKAHRRHSTRRESHDWLTPRGSISSVMSTSLQNFAYQLESESEVDEDDKNIPPVSDWQLMKQNAPEWMYIAVGSIAAFIQGACFPIFAMVFGFAMGMFSLSNRDEIFRLSVVYSGIFMLVAAIAGISMALQSYTFTSAGLKMTSRLRQQYFASLLKQEIGFYDKLTNSVGALCNRLSSDAADVQGATGLRIGLILQGFSSVFVGFVMAMSYNWKLTLVGMAFLPLMVGSIWLEGIISQKSQLNERAAMESATVIATEAVISIRTVQSLGVEKIFLDQFEKSLAVAARSVAQKTRWRGLVLGLGLYVPFLAYCSATVYGTVLVARESLDYSIVLLVNEAIMYGAYMLGQSLVYAPNFKSAKLSGARILATVNRVPRVRSKDGLRSRTEWKASGQFHLRDLEFSYHTQPNHAVLRGFDLKVDAGKTVALVGASGCGKSTVLQLLQRFYDPDAGSIELDGRDSRTALTLARLRRQLGVVQQEPVLFDRSLAENIAYGDNARKVSMQEIIAAAKAANIHNFVVSLPQGYDTNLGSGGAQLSGGQKQRVCIARALIRHPRLLLLDEATSALDANSEKAVTEALEAAAKGRTCITIAHRLSTVKDADLICVVDKGSIVEKGTHAELISLQGYYWKMNKGQHNH